jgi:hypothetical protein
MWNEFNKVVQCHNCGHVYVPAKLPMIDAMVRDGLAVPRNPEHVPPSERGITIPKP